MYLETPRTLLALAFLAVGSPTLADDCAAVKTAMLNSGHLPHTALITKTDAQGKKTVTRQVQTVDNKYVQLPDGKWYAMNIAIKDLKEDALEVQTCRGSGSDSFNGESTLVYAIHLNMGEASDQKWWVSSKNLVIKTESIMEGSHYVVEYDYAHATPPANAIPLGGK